MPRNWILTLLTLAFSISALPAEDPVAQFDAANQAYEVGDYETAIELYRSLENDGHVSAPLYLNLGNAYYQNQQLGHAIATYRAGLRLAPRRQSLVQNLEFVLDESTEASTPPPVYTSFLLRLSLNEWTWLFVLPFLGFSFSLILRRLPACQNWIRPTTAPLGALSVVGLIALIFAEMEWNRDWAVVTGGETTARFGPLAESKRAFTAAETAHLEVVDRKGDWARIINSRNERGWVSIDSIDIYTDRR